MNDWPLKIPRWQNCLQYEYGYEIDPEKMKHWRYGKGGGRNGQWKNGRSDMSSHYRPLPFLLYMYKDLLLV
jgi:hypothetical protein